MTKTYKIKDVKKVLGNLTFLSFDGDERVNSGRGRNATTKLVGRRYACLSDTQADVNVLVKGSLPVIGYPYQSKIRLVNPELMAVVRNINGNRSAYIEWEICCDGMERI